MTAAPGTTSTTAPAGGPAAGVARTDVPVLEAIHVSKYFGPTTALVDVSLQAWAGRIVALLGDNGAGKSTLIKILCGVYPPDRGEIRHMGDRVEFAGPSDARKLGIATCFQDLAVCELLSVSRNVVLGREPMKGIGPFRWLDIKEANDITRQALLGLGIRFERGLEERGANLSGGERQSLAIARAMFFGSACLILDEPTSSLAARPAAKVLEHIVAAKEKDAAVILITHNYRHAMSVADDVVVLAQGRVIGNFKAKDVDLDTVTELVSRVT
jgi:simple sugar transport system ATP-binding protein